ncbi:response regulator [Paenibacillus chartarius]|uniref:Response regulator n=1 Tax=Paenibacillus chartarius TaxID=747481 RepID=A0ABV6DMT3_9BACL
MTIPGAYRLLIADDHKLARQAVRSVLSGPDSPFTIIGEAVNGAEAVRLCDELLPDAVLMDLQMPGMNGLEATKLIKLRHPHIRVVMLTVSDDVADLFTAIRNGAQGYLLKNMNPDEWSAYLLALLDDHAEVPRQMADKLFHRFRSHPALDSASATEAGASPLTAREQELATLVAAGYNNREIAERLVIAENTVKNHMKNILDKLGLNNRVQLTAYAIQRGWTRNAHESQRK